MATFTVDTVADSVDSSDGNLSLREAVGLANDSPGVDTIVFDAGVFDGTPDDIIRLTSGQIQITDALVIDGGPDRVTVTGDADGDDLTTTVDGVAGITDVAANREITTGIFGDPDTVGDNSRIFDITNADALTELNNLVLTGGRSFGESGGAVRSTGRVDVDGSLIAGNFAQDVIAPTGPYVGYYTIYYGNGGGIQAQGAVISNSTITENLGTFGGGIRTSGDIEVRGSIITGNTAENGSGGGLLVLGAASISNSTVRENSAVYKGNDIFTYDTGIIDGGGIVSRGDLTVMGSTVSGNSSSDDGGGIVARGDLTVMGSTVSGNSSSDDGGGIVARGDLTVAGSTVSGNSSRDGGGISAKGDLTVTGSTVSGNSSSGIGGGIFTGGFYVDEVVVTISDSTIRENTAGFGGGLVAFSSYITVTDVTDSEITDNVARNGGGIATFGSLTVKSSTVSGNTASETEGGGIFHNGNITLYQSTISDNTAGTVGGGVYANRGMLAIQESTLRGNSAGVDGGAAVINLGDATISDSTIVNNSAGGDGGGLAVGSFVSDDDVYTPEIALTNSTVTGNSAGGYGGAVFAYGINDTEVAVTTTFSDSILLGNRANAAGDEVSGGSLAFTGANIVGADGDAFDASVSANVANADPATVFAQVSNGAGVLTDNGGPTETVLILRGGAAQDVDSAAGILETDQRGLPRPFGQTAPDIGAVELQEAPSLVVTTTADLVDQTDGLTSLREAVAFANSGDADGDGKAGDTITFDPGVFGDGTGRIVLDGSQIQITETLTIDGGPAGVTIDGDGRSRLLRLAEAEADLALHGLTLTGGTTPQSGGAVVAQGDLTIVETTVIANAADSFGGGLYGTADVTLVNSTIRDNTSELSGGGLLGQDVTAVNSTISGNSAGINGGGMFAESATLRNSTVSGNGAQDGGGIFARGRASDSLAITGTLTVTDSIVLGNTGNEIAGTAARVFEGANIVGADGAAFDASVSGNVVNADPAKVFAEVSNGAGVLADNGGPTETVLILRGGAAHDAAVETAGTPDTDQRGLPRPVEGAPDIGAVELQDGPVELTLALASDSVAEGESTTLALTRAGDIPAPLRVALSSDDETEATLPAEARFGAGEAEIEVTVTTETDGTEDPDQTATIAAGGVGVVETTIALTVEDIDSPPNTAPEGQADGFTLEEDDTLVVAAPGVLGNDTDAEDDPLTAALVEGVANGSLTLNTDGSFTYIPDADFDEGDSFTYIASDGKADSSETRVTLTVTPVNDPPVAVDDGGPGTAGFSTDEDTGFTTASVLSNDTDIDGGPLSVAGVDTAGTLGTVVDNGDGTFDYDPASAFNALDAGEVGTDTFVYTVADGRGGEDEATVTVTVAGADDVLPEVRDEDGDGVVIATDAAETVVAPDTPIGVVTGLGGSDVFRFVDTPGQRVFLRINDFAADDPEADALDLGGAGVAQSLTLGSNTYLLLEGADRDTVLLVGIDAEEAARVQIIDESEVGASALL